MIPREVEKKRKGETHDLICREARELFITFDTSLVGMLFVFCRRDFNITPVSFKPFDLQLLRRYELNYVYECTPSLQSYEYEPFFQ